MRVFIIVILYCLVWLNPILADENKIRAVVNNDIITQYDFDNRYQTFIYENNINILQLPAQRRKALQSEVLQQLIDDLLRKQLADEHDILDQFNVVDNHIAQIMRAQQAGDIEAFKKLLQKSGITYDAYRSFLNQQFRWLAYVKQAFTKNNPISNADIDAQIAYIESNDGEKEYLLSELRIPFDLFNKEAAINIVKQIIQQLNQNVPFNVLVRNSQKIPNNVLEGNDLGWTIAGQYQEVEIEVLLQDNPDNKILGPIEKVNSFIFLYLANQRQITFDAAQINRDAIKTQLEARAEQLFAERLLSTARQDSFIEIR